jgi:hypothetical protein
MDSQLEEFSRRAGSLLAETGILEKRPSWVAVKAGATSLAPFSEPTVARLLPEHALVFILALTNAGSKRDVLIKALLQNVLTTIPSDGFVRLLSKFSQAELKDNLLPIIYEAGNRGSVACYLAARLKVTLSPEAFQYFLKARSWHQADLMNLCLLVKPEESKALCSYIESLIPTIESKTVQESFSEFRNILFNHLAIEPVLPEVAVQEHAPTIIKAPPPKELPQEARPQATKPQKLAVSEPAAVLPPVSAPPKSVEMPENKLPTNATPKNSGPATTINLHLSLPENLQKVILPIGGVLLALIAGLAYFA